MQKTVRREYSYRKLVARIKEIRRIRGLDETPLTGPHPEPSCEAHGEWHNLLWNLVRTAAGRWWMLGVSERLQDAAFVAKAIQQTEEELPRIRSSRL